MRNSILAAVRRVPASLPALDDGARQLTFGDMNRMVEQERRWLNSFVVQRCALFAENSCSWVVSDLALMAGNVMHAPLPPSLTECQEKEALDQAGVDFILTDEPARFCDGCHGFSIIGRSHRTGFSLLRRDVSLRRKITDCFAKIIHLPFQSSSAHRLELNIRDIESEAISLLNVAAQQGVARHMCVLPFSTLLENIAGVYVPLMLGGQIIIRPIRALGISESDMDVQKLLQALHMERPESMVLVPKLLSALIDAIQQGSRIPSSLKFIAVGDGACVELLRVARCSGLPVFEGDRLTRTNDYFSMRSHTPTQAADTSSLAVSA